MWEMVSTNHVLLIVPSHSNHEFRLIRRSGAHYLWLFRRPLAIPIVRSGGVLSVAAIVGDRPAFGAFME